HTVSRPAPGATQTRPDPAADQADDEGQGREAGVRRAEALDDLEPAWQEDDRPEERERGEERRAHRRRVRPDPEQVERDDRLLGPGLGPDEEQVADETGGDQP